MLAGTGWLLGAADPTPFVPPAEGPVAFRRDKIPLEVDTMAGLSKQLEMMARGLSADTPSKRRAAAQMLALSLALDPANAKAREVIAEYMAKRHQPMTDTVKLENSRAVVWQAIGWLDSPDAGSHGQALANCLKDVIIVSDPKNPKSDGLREAGEKGQWTGWIPAVAAYEATAEIAKTEVTETPKESVKDFPGGSVEKPEVFLDHAEVQTLLWKGVEKDGVSRWVLAVAPLQMSSKKPGKNEPGGHGLSIAIGAAGARDSFTKVDAMLKNLLEKQHPDLSKDIQITITSKELEASLQSKKKHSLSAASAVLANAALTGTEPNAIVIGQINDSGAFKLSPAFWDQILALGKGSGQRLLLPAEAEALMPSILAMENPAFFLKYEVLLAPDLKGLLELATTKPASPLANTLAKFREIREKAGTQDIRQYIANPFVRGRLAEIAQELPGHLSAKLLLMQSEGRRPTLVARKVLAAELRRALEPMEWICDKPEEDFTAQVIPRLLATYELCRSNVEAFDRHVEKADRDLLDRARAVITTIRETERTARGRGETNAVKAAVRTVRNDLIAKHTDLTDLLVQEAGDAPPT